MLGEIFVHARICNIKLHPIFYKMLYMSKTEIQKKLIYVQEKSEDQEEFNNNSQYIFYSLDDIKIFGSTVY